MARPPSPAPRTARVEIRLTPEDHALVTEAAALGGDDVAAFVRRAAVLAARALVRRVGTAGVPAKNRR